MRGMITIAISFLLFVFAAAAGNNNIATVVNAEVMTGDIITAANFAQLSDIDANLIGNGIASVQTMVMEGSTNNLVGGLNKQGLPDGNTFILQSGDMMLNYTGNINVPHLQDTDMQVILLAANGNQVATGNITQVAVQVDNNKGNNNDVFQFTAEAAGVTGILGAVGVTPSSNVLTDSEIKQLSYLDVLVTGNTNTAEQMNLQGAFDSTMTGSKLWQQATVCANVLGNNNVALPLAATAPFLPVAAPFVDGLVLVPMQTSVQLADDNTMTKSAANQMICQNVYIAENSGQFAQLGVESMNLDILTNAGVLQKINENIKSLGNSNIISQNTALTSTANVVTGGNIIQQSDIDTNS